jgi:hypothetical protein
MGDHVDITEDELGQIRARAEEATAGPWAAFVEGRDHLAGDDFIRTGGLNNNSPDIYVSEYVGATNIKVPAADLDFIANSRQDIPRLLAALQPRDMQLIGYWRNDQHPEYPDPNDFVFEPLPEEQRDLLVTALENGARVRFFMGYSTCRICGHLNGTSELTDGEHQWPEGLVHYIKDHNVSLPVEVMNSVCRRYEQLEAASTSLVWWLSAAAYSTASHPAWAWLREHDDPTHLERPPGFDLAAETLRAHRLVVRLAKAFAWQVTTDAGTGAVQDASFLGDIEIPDSATASGERIVIRLSNFGQLAVVALERFGINDANDIAVLFDVADRRRVERALEDEGYRQVPEWILWRDYDGTSEALRAAYESTAATWWVRYFDYL